MPIVVEQKVNAMISNALEVLVVESNQNWLHQPSVTKGHILDLISFRNVSIKVENNQGSPSTFPCTDHTTQLAPCTCFHLYHTTLKKQDGIMC